MKLFRRLDISFLTLRIGYPTDSAHTVVEISKGRVAKSGQLVVDRWGRFGDVEHTTQYIDDRSRPLHISMHRHAKATYLGRYCRLSQLDADDAVVELIDKGENVIVCPGPLKCRQMSF